MTVRQPEGQPLGPLSRLSPAQNSSPSRGAGAVGSNGPVSFGLLPLKGSSRPFQSLLDASRNSSSSYSVEAAYAAPIYTPGAMSPGNGMLSAHQSENGSSAIYRPDTGSSSGGIEQAAAQAGDAAAKRTDSGAGRSTRPSSTEDSRGSRGSAESSTDGATGSARDGTAGRDAKRADDQAQVSAKQGKSDEGSPNESGKGGGSSKETKAAHSQQKGDGTAKSALTKGAEAAAAKLIGAEAATLAAQTGTAHSPAGPGTLRTDAELAQLIGRAAQSSGRVAQSKFSKLTVEDLRTAAAKQLVKGGTSVQVGLDQVKRLFAGTETTKAAGAAKPGKQSKEAKPNPVELLKQQVATGAAKQLPVEHAGEHHNGGDNSNQQAGGDNSGKLHSEQGIQTAARTNQPAPPAPTANGAYTELARQLRDGLKSEIVREAKVVLRDNNAGEIRMTLRPESLGRVRIQLHVLDNRIGGQIFVDNVNVRDVFQQNLSQLYQAFRDSGFETGMLEVAVGNGSGQAPQGQNGDDTRDDQAPRRVAPTAIGALEGSVPRFGDVVYASSKVNLVV